MLTNKTSDKFGDKGIAKKMVVLCTCCILMSMCGLLNQAIANNFSKNALNYQSIQDPTKPPTKPNTQSSAQQTLTPKYVLTAIFSRSTQTYAVINGSILKVGDSLANIQVVEINESSVVIREQSSSKKDVVLELDGSVSVKKQVSQ